MPDNNRDNIEQIKERIDIVEYIGRYLHLKRAGRNFVAVCPFHKEKTPSFSISPDLQIYKCFGCGKSGDIFSFLMDYENLDFPEILERLAKETGVKLEKGSFKSGANSNIPLKITLMINTLATNFFIKQLACDKTIQDYYHRRGFTDETIKNFKLGYAPKNRSALLQYVLSQAKFNQKQLIDSGLFVEKYGKLTDKFFDRAIFPITNQKGEVIGFTGRVINKDDQRPKYLNSPETAAFKKAYNVYGIYHARQEIRKKDLCIICEGSTDVMSTHQAGFANIVAPLGTALTDGQVALIKKYTNNILVIFDNDEAGQKAVERAFFLTTKVGINCYANNTGEYKDLDELIQKNPTALSKLIKDKIDTFTYLLLAKLGKLDLTRMADYNVATSYIKQLLLATDDPIKRNYFIKKAAKITGIKDEIFTPQRELTEKIGKTQYSNKKDIDKVDFERLILAYVIHKKLPNDVKLNKKFFTIEAANDIITTGKCSDERILLPSPRFQTEISDMEDEDFKNLYARLKKDYYKKRLRHKKQLLSIEEEKPSPDKSTINKLMKEIMTLSKKI